MNLGENPINWSRDVPPGASASSTASILAASLNSVSNCFQFKFKKSEEKKCKTFDFAIEVLLESSTEMTSKFLNFFDTLQHHFLI